LDACQGTQLAEAIPEAIRKVTTMSRTYVPKNKEAIGRFDGCDFDVNVAGAQLLGIVSFKANFFSQSIRLKTGEKCTPFSASAEECRRAAGELRALSSQELYELWQEGRDLFEGTTKDFDEFVASWAVFLETCDGYEVP